MRRNRGAHPYGFARLDAIGAIFNEITAAAMGLPGNAKPADAPVSYPFIWDTPQHDKVQWNGSVENNGAGSLGRNVGEVLGVFGSLRLDTRLIPRGGHQSSVDVSHLGQLEELLWKLQSPQWPGTILPAVDDTNGSLAKGRQAFERFCVGCHADIRRDDPERSIKSELTPLSELGTDPAMAANFAQRRYDSGPLQSRLKTYIFVPGQRFKPFGDEGMGVEFLGNAVIGTITYNLIRRPHETVRALNAGRKPGDILFQAKDDLAGKLIEVARHMRIAGMLNEQAAELVYKGRPLNGIWATAPYLHNGSVRTMRQLLLPAAQRQRTFHVGSREYDPNDMGFVDEGSFTLDTTLPGNSNAGHEYGADKLTRDLGTLDALLAYLKTL